jgi:Tol biopolymer transport system component
MDGPSQVRQANPSESSGPERLDSWKEIAKYLRRDVRTVQRWEKTEGLPVHRHLHGMRSTAYALKSELDVWWYERLPRLTDSPQGTSEVPSFQRSEAGETSRLEAEPETSPRARSRRWLVPAALAGIALTASFIYWITPPPLPQVLKTQRLSGDGRIKQGLQTDGARLYFLEHLPGGKEFLAQMSVAGGEIFQTPTPFDVTNIEAISPDGSQLLIRGASGRRPDHEMPFWEVRSMGGDPHLLGELTGNSAAWSPDGEQIAYANGSNLYAARRDGSGVQRLAALRGKVGSVAWSPDGRWLRFTETDSRSDQNSMWQIRPDGTQLRAFLSGWNSPRSGEKGCWTPDGRYFVFLADRSHVVSLWTVKEPIGRFPSRSATPIQLITDFNEIKAFTLSKDGKRIFVLASGVGHAELVRYDPRAGEFSPYLSGIPVGEMDYSPDGTWVAYDESPDGPLFRMRANGVGRAQLTEPPMDVKCPRWSPDGKQIAFMGRLDDRSLWQIFVIFPEGGRPKQLTFTAGDKGAPTWSREGSRLVFGDLLTSKNMVIHLYDFKTGEISDLPGSEGLWTARWSPDGRHIAAMTRDQHTVKLFDETSGTWSELLSRPLEDSFDWSADSRYLYVHLLYGDDAGVSRLKVRDRILEPVVSLKNLSDPTKGFGWVGIATDGSILATRVSGSDEIYAFDVNFP